MTNMISRIWSVLTSFYAKSNSSSIPSDRDFSSRKRGRIEPLEERNLLAVAVATLFPAPENETSAPAVYATETPTEAPTIQIDLNEAFSNAELEDDDYTITPVSDASADEGEEDALVPDFVRDGIAYYSATKLIARQVVFDLGDVNPNDDLADGDPIFLGENSGEFSNLGAGDSPRSGGGDPTTYPLVVQTTCSSSLVNICTDKVNPLQESRCGTSSDPLTNSDYVTVTLPTLPFGYRAEVSFSPSAFQYCTAYVPDGADFNSVTSFQYSGGATVYLVPNNNSAPESDRVVTLTLNTPCPLESGGGTCVFDEICMTATATIIDDDQWVVTVEATDDKAIERLPGVEPDYGEYTFTRAHNREGIPGDTSYAINLEFKTLQTPDFYSPFYCPQYGTDYLLTTQTQQGSTPPEYLVGFTGDGSYVDYDLIDDDCGVLFNLFRGSIPVDRTSSKLRLVTGFDWNDEGEKTLETDADPGRQQGEIVELTLTRAYWGGLGDNGNCVGDPAVAEVEIKDGAVAHIYQGPTEESEIIDEEEVFFRRNDNDDNNNGQEDWLDGGEDKDLRRIVPRVWLGAMAIPGGHYIVRVRFKVDGTAITPWMDPARVDEYNPPIVNGLEEPIETLDPDDVDFDYPFYFEGVDFGSGGATLDVDVAMVDETGLNVTETTAGTSVDADFYISPLFVDIDIDTMNETKGGDGPVSRSEAAEKFENNTFSLGKVMLPFATMTDKTFYTIVLEIPSDIDLEDMTLRLDYRMADQYDVVGVPIDGYGGPGGTIRIWNRQYDAALPLNPNSVKTDGGNLVVSSVGDLTYAPEDLGFTDSIRTVSLYVEAVEKNWQCTPEAVRFLGRPKTCIDFSITVDNKTAHDKVRYVVAGANDYYYKIMDNPKLLAAYTSDLVYTPISSETDCLRMLTYSEVEHLQLSNITYDSHSYSFADVLSWSSNHESGFLARLYRDYIVGEYYFAFAGTLDPFWVDVLNDINQAVPTYWSAPQYEIAVQMGYAIANTNGVIGGKNLYVTGHSLGGGLASVASIIGNIRGFTFNAAGIRKETLYLKDANGNPIVLTPGCDILLRFDNPDTLISAYYADFDGLSYAQQNVPFMPEEVGFSVRLISEYNTSHSLLTSLGDALKYGYKCHLIKTVISAMEYAIFPYFYIQN